MTVPVALHGMRMAAAMRRDIVYGHLPPGARIPQHEYAKRYHVGPVTAHKAVAVLEREGLVHEHFRTCYAASAGPPDPAVAARLGATLARLRNAAGHDPVGLGTGRWSAWHVTGAEDGGRAEHDQEHGRGLAMVDLLSYRWAAISYPASRPSPSGCCSRPSDIRSGAARRQE